MRLTHSFKDLHNWFGTIKLHFNGLFGFIILRGQTTPFARGDPIIGHKVKNASNADITQTGHSESWNYTLTYQSSMQPPLKLFLRQATLFKEQFQQRIISLCHIFDQLLMQRGPEGPNHEKSSVLPGRLHLIDEHRRLCLAALLGRSVAGELPLAGS